MRDRPIDLEQHLHVLGVGAALADLRGDGGSTWQARGVTAVSGLEAAGGAALADQFAAAIYLEESPPMVRTDVP